VGAVSPRLGIYLLTGFRITPNADVIGGHARLQSWRLSRERCGSGREWRREIDTARRTVPAPIHTADGGDALGSWEESVGDRMGSTLARPGTGTLVVPSPSRPTVAAGRPTRAATTRWGASGKGGPRSMATELYWTPRTGSGIRDHSWGIYEGRPPLGGHTRWLPPSEIPAARRGVTVLLFFATDEFSGYFHLHEDEDGRQIVMNDAFGNAVRGCDRLGLVPEADSRLCDPQAEIRVRNRDRCLGARSRVVDADGGQMAVLLRSYRPPPLCDSTGWLSPGSWRTAATFTPTMGRRIRTWSGTTSIFRTQPARHTIVRRE